MRGIFVGHLTPDNYAMTIICLLNVPFGYTKLRPYDAIKSVYYYYYYMGLGMSFGRPIDMIHFQRIFSAMQWR